MSISVSIVEDDQSVSVMLREWIGHADGFSFLQAHSSVTAAIAAVPTEPPDVLLVDINLGGQSGIECVRTLKPMLPETQFLMLTVFEDGDHIFDALTAGASGYLLKRTPREELLAAIDQVYQGGSPMTSYIARKVVHWFHNYSRPEAKETETLSAREKEILRLLARGFAYKEMADALGISMGTINTHVRRIYHKLHVRSRGEAVAVFANIPGAKEPP